MQKKVSDGLDLLQYYTTKDWIFKNDNLKSLRDKLNSRDSEIFNFDFRKIHWDDFIRNYILGTREFLLKEKPETIPKSRRLLKRYVWIC